MGESNWAYNHQYAAETVVTPHTRDEVRAAVAAASSVKALGEAGTASTTSPTRPAGCSST